MTKWLKATAILAEGWGARRFSSHFSSEFPEYQKDQSLRKWNLKKNPRR